MALKPNATYNAIFRRVGLPERDLEARWINSHAAEGPFVYLDDYHRLLEALAPAQRRLTDLLGYSFGWERQQAYVIERCSGTKDQLCNPDAWVHDKVDLSKGIAEGYSAASREHGDTANR